MRLNYHILTPAEKEHIIAEFPNKPTQQLANEMGLKYNTIANFTYSIKLKKTPEFLKSDLSGRLSKLIIKGCEYRYPKGNIPVNKGKKMPPEIYEKVKPTMFKKGHIPQTMVHNGKPYLYARIKKNGQKEVTWKIHVDQKRLSYLAYLCQQNGIDLTGKKPRLKPGYDFLKVPTIDDIIVVTNRENMNMNTIYRYPEELVKLIRIRGALNRQINNLQKV